MGLYPLEVVPLETREKTEIASRVVSGRPLARAALALWARMIGQGLSAGLSITQALHLLADQEKGRLLGQVADTLEKKVTAGVSLADAMSQIGNAFSAVAVSLVRAGEASGALEQVLQALASQVEAEADLVSKVRGALVYPVFVLTVGVGTVAVLVWGVVPKLMLLFAETGQPLPLATRILVGMGRGLVFGAGLAALGVVIGVWLVRRRGWKIPISQLGMVVLSRLPLFGQLIRQSEIARLSATLGLLLEQGLPLPDTLQLVAGTVSRPQLKMQIQRSHRDVVEGMSVSAGFRRAGIREPFLLTMIAMGEAQGDLARAFLQAGTRYHEEVDRTVKVLSTLIEPVMILLVGLIVGGIVFSMLLPIFQINFSVG